MISSKIIPSARSIFFTAELRKSSKDGNHRISYLVEKNQFQTNGNEPCQTVPSNVPFSKLLFDIQYKLAHALLDNENVL